MPNFETDLALNAYRALVRLEVGMLQKVEQSISSSASKSEFELKGLAGHLDAAAHKLEVDLQQKYYRLCQVDPAGRAGYTANFNGTLDYWSDRIMVAKVRLLTLAPPVSVHPPTVVPTQPQRTPNMDYQHLPRLDTLSSSGRVEYWPEFQPDWLACYGSLREDVQIQ